MASEKRRLRPGRRTALAAGLAVLALLAAAFAFREELIAWYVGYRFIWLPEGVEARWGKSLNAAGQLLVAGREGDSDGVWSVGSGSIRRLELPSGWDGVARAAAINEQGQIVGGVEPRVGDGTNWPFRWSPEGGMRVTTSPGTGRTVFTDLNESGEAVGFFEVWQPSLGLHSVTPVLWTPRHGFRYLELLAQRPLNYADAINESGWIVGSATAKDGKVHPVRWMPPHHQAQDLGLPAGFDGGYAVAINDGGAVLVNLWNEHATAGVSDRENQPVIWTEERGYLALSFPEGFSHVTEIGTVLVCGNRGKCFLIRREQVLGIPRPWGATLCEYHGLSDHGWLIGRARMKDFPDSWRGFVARPVR